ncbi:MAG TPA: hypothetical protein VGO00_27600, partial [Kofleriaceae bacterium]|nr:hypothetical protein [Kofleriaceae bacterium]
MRLAIVGMIVWSATAFAAPGPLAGVHAKLDCVQCHDNGNPASSPAKCLHCHAAVGTSRSLHASPIVADSTCGTCHADHRGQSADISGWPAVGGIDHFDHAASGYRLVGSHAGVSCAKCHSGPGVRFTGLVRDCGSCHHSPHPDTKFFHRACETCHSPMVKSLSLAVVDHSVYPLGKHVGPKVACDGCHTAASGAGPADITCERCHATASRHGERFKGRACTECHRAATSWTPNSFNHTTTKFRLSFRHAELRCRDCHRGKDPAEFERLPTDTKCIGCHAHRNVHADATHPAGRYRDDQCTQCHLNPGPLPKRPFVAEVHGVNGTYPLV